LSFDAVGLTLFGSGARMRAADPNILLGVEYVAVGLGALLGANLRFVVANWAIQRFPLDFPYGTLIVNVSGAFAIGVVLAFLGERAGLSPLWRLFFVTGFLGGYTTFSTYAWEVLALVQTGNLLPAAVYLLGSNGIGLIGVWLGAQLGRL
jgi:fluoride exporter